MKRFFMVVVAILAVVFMQAPFAGTAEAARVAALPIQVDEAQVKRAADFTGYYWDIIIEKFPYPEYELMDDTKVAAAVPEEGLKTFDKTTLIDICNKADADIVVAMRLDKAEDRPIMFRREPTLETFMKGEFVGYNRLTDKYYARKIYEKGEIEEVLTLRTDWQQRVFAAELDRCLYRFLEEKKTKAKKNNK